MKYETQNDIKNLFNDIAPKYDFVNNIISLFTHKLVRRIAIKTLKIKEGSKVLDLCCGSGDFGSFVKNAKVIGADFSSEMIKQAQKKYPNIQYFVQDATNLSFEDNSFDYVIMSFGLRNIKDKPKALNEIKRVLKNGGYYLHLDFGEKNIFNNIYNKLILAILKPIIKNVEPYKYLVNSKNHFKSPDELINTFEENGFRLIKRKDMLFNIISFQIMQK